MKTFVTIYLSSLLSLMVFTALIQYPLNFEEKLIYALMTTGFIYFMSNLSK